MAAEDTEVPPTTNVHLVDAGGWWPQWGSRNAQLESLEHHGKVKNVQNQK